MGEGAQVTAQVVTAGSDSQSGIPPPHGHQSLLGESQQGSLVAFGSVVPRNRKEGGRMGRGEAYGGRPLPGRASSTIAISEHIPIPVTRLTLPLPQTQHSTESRLTPTILSS